MYKLPPYKVLHVSTSGTLVINIVTEEYRKCLQVFQAVYSASVAHTSLSHTSAVFLLFTVAN
jgi:hypothetical protein